MLETIENDIDALCEDASFVAQKVLDAFDSSFTIRSNDYKIGCSIGIALIDETTSNADDVLKRADTAMYLAKKQGGGHFMFFDPALQRIADYRLELEKDILRGIQENQFKAWFQPQMSCTGTVLGAEALIRWHHPEKGIIPPIEFIPIAEQFGLVDQLQQIVLKDVCHLLTEIDNTATDISDTFSVAVNISAVQFKREDFATQMLQIVQSLNQSPERIKLEITESMLVENVQLAILQMKTLKSNGFRFSVDDFGTGYSSLTYLQTFPIDELKIDKSFIDKIESEDSNTAIVDTIISLSHNLGCKVIAEGVETEHQCRILRDKAVHALQGYFFSKPMPMEAFLNWITQQKVAC